MRNNVKPAFICQLYELFERRALILFTIAGCGLVPHVERESRSPHRFGYGRIFCTGIFPSAVDGIRASKQVESPASFPGDSNHQQLLKETPPRAPDAGVRTSF